MNNSFTEWFILCVTKKYADFNGRARRKEFWMYILVGMILSTLLTIVENVIGLTIPVGDPMLGASVGILSSILSLALFIPGLAVSIRRLHDVSKSGWWILVTLIPLLGIIYFIYLAASNGTSGSNQYGENPKGE